MRIIHPNPVPPTSDRPTDCQEGDPHTEGEETYLTADMREEFEQLKEEPSHGESWLFDDFFLGINFHGISWSNGIYPLA